MVELKAGIYRHYKGEFYLVIGLAHHSETMERMVVYVPLYIREGPRMCVRPADMFFGKVCLRCSKGQANCTCVSTKGWVPRFAFVGYEFAPK